MPCWAWLCHHPFRHRARELDGYRSHRGTTSYTKYAQDDESWFIDRLRAHQIDLSDLAPVYGRMNLSSAPVTDILALVRLEPGCYLDALDPVSKEAAVPSARQDIRTHAQIQIRT